MIGHRFQTKSDVQALLTEADARPRHRWGQNFLIDGNLLRRLVATADVTSNDVVLEVGPGTGAVTDYLARTAKSVVAVEIDPALHSLLTSRFADHDNVTLLHTDVLSGKHQVAPAAIEACRRAVHDATGRLMLVANLPYNVATPLLMELLLGDLPFNRLCFTVQREMADRFSARERTKDYGPVSVITQATSDVERVTTLPPSVFWPAPKVDSAMVRVDVRRNPFGTRDGLRRFAELVRGGFAHRRKTLKYNLRRVVGEETCAMLGESFDLTLRPEALNVETWVRLGQRSANFGSES